MLTMDFKTLRIVFMGTPEFAVASLKALHEAGCTIVGVVTAPDKPGGRGMQLQQSAVKQYAAANGLPVLQPEKLKNPEFVAQLSALKADLQIVVAFRMLPEIVWNMPPMGTVNVHGSLLPQYRGAAPINWAVINGEPFTGVTTFKLKHEIDTGDILLQEKIAIAENDNAGTIHDKMKEIGAQLLLTTIKELATGKISALTQEAKMIEDNVQLKHAPKIFTETCEIDWNKNADTIRNLIRGLSPYPAAFTFLEGKRLKIFSAKIEKNGTPEKTGVPETDGKHYLRFSCADGYVYAEELQLEGKRKMLVEEFLRGFKR